MGDKNPIRTLRDYSKPSYKGYRNTIKLPVRNNAVPLRPDTIRLVQNACSFHELRFEDPNQHLKDFLKLMDSLDLDGENRERTIYHHMGGSYYSFPYLILSTGKDRKTSQRYPDVPTTSWRISLRSMDSRTIDQSADGKLRDQNTEESWALLEDLALYDNEIWNDLTDFAKPVKAITMPQDVSSTSDRHLIELENHVQRLMETHLAPTLDMVLEFWKFMAIVVVCGGSMVGEVEYTTLLSMVCEVFYIREKNYIEPLSHRLKNNRDAHEDYLKKTIENTDTIRGLVERTRKQNPSEPLIDSACKFTKHVQELLVYVSQTCPSFKKPSEKLVVVTPMNKVKKVRFSEPLTSSSNIHKQVESSKTPDSNTHVLPSLGLKSSTSASRSQPTGNKKNVRISQTTSSNMKNKVEVQYRRVKYKSNKKNRVKDPICDANVKHTMLNANSELICVKYKKCMFDANDDVCFLNFVNDVNMLSKSKSDKKSQQHNIWKPTSKVFTEVRHKWKPIGRLFTIVGNSCPLTRITPTKVVHLKETTSNSGETQKPEIKVYTRRPKQVKSIGCSDCSLVSGLRMLKTYDRESLSSHELHQ
ncbi:hypothetical protein Tco_0974283 [Tanacetum coccineum]|uniref:MAK10-like protein n=1 Tax=Tanacetum coccineum TaxID=301880 RepID=A0ABQ5EBB3_9ASTR